MENEQAYAGQDGRTPSREIKFSGANGDRNIFVFPVSRIVDRTRLIHTLLYVITIHTYIHKKRKKPLNSCRHQGGNGGDFGGTRKRCRKGSVGPVAANSNIVEINKEAGGEHKEL